MSGAGYLAASVPLRLTSAGSVVALPILAVTELDDVALGGILVASILGPSVLAAPLAGVALDHARHPRRLVLVSAILTATAFAVSSGIGFVPIPIVLVALMLAGCTTPFFMGGLSSFVTEEIDDERRAFALDALSYNVGAVGGPGLVALTIVAGSARMAPIVLTAVALMGALGLLATRLPPRPVPDEHPLRTILTGTRHLVRHRPLAIVILSGTMAQIGAGALPIAAVVLATQRTGDPDPGAWIVTAFAIGGLIGGIVTAARRWTNLPLILVMGGGFAAIGALTAVAALDLGIGWTIGVIGASGLFSAASSAVLLRIRKQQSTLRVRSQVFTVGAGLRTTAAAVGAVIAGFAAGADGAILFIAIGMVWVASALVLFAFPRGTQPLPGS